MSFRERPEYQAWRAAVFQLFGSHCILCRHDANLHVHHVRPVATYPELALQPTNGVPLCGNCHVGIKDREMEYVAEFQRRQRAILAGLRDDGDQGAQDSVRGVKDFRRAHQDAPCATAGDDDGNGMTEAVKDFHRAHPQQFHKIHFMSSLLRVVTGMFRELAAERSSQGHPTASSECILNGYATLFGTRSLDEACLRVLIVALKVAKEQLKGDGDAVLVKSLSLLMDDLPPEDAKLIESIRNGIPTQCAELLTHEPDNSRLDGFDFDSFVYTPNLVERERPITEDTMRLRAELDPSAGKAVEQWFQCATNSQDVIDFYNRFHKQFRKSALLYLYLAEHLKCLGRFDDALKTIDAAARLAEREGVASELGETLVHKKASYLESLEKNAEATAVLEQGVRHFPTSALLHNTYSQALWDGRSDVPNECVEHALKAVKFDPTNITCIRWGFIVTRAAKNYATSIELGERHLALVTAPNDKTDALTGIAEVYCDNKLYDDSIRYLKMILTIDGRHADAMARWAHCLFMQGKKVEAKQMAKKALMFDPSNQLALAFSV